jgi:subtilisin family serine protease
LEHLEVRCVPATVTPLPAQLTAPFALPAYADVGQPPIHTLIWNGRAVDAIRGQWIAEFAGITGSTQQQLDAIQSYFVSTGQPFQVLQHLGADGLVLFSTPESYTHESLAKLLDGTAVVDTLAPNLVGSLGAIPNDTFFSFLWGLHNVGQTINGQAGFVDRDIDAPEAWDASVGSSSVVIGVVDSGVMYTHPDLYLNVWINQNEIPLAIRTNLTDVDADGLITFRDLNNPINIGPGKITDLNGTGYIDGGDVLFPVSSGGWADGIDNNLNGRVDDLIGYDFVGNTTAFNTFDNDPMDQWGHGTHVAGTIGAVGNNALGVTGVAQRVQLMPLKVGAGSTSISVAGAIAALNYMNTLHDQGVNIKASNHSWGGNFSTVGAFNTAVEGNRARGILFVAAAGNSNLNNDVNQFNPANLPYDNVISVLATDNRDNPASFSNWGAVNVDLGAPGVDIVSTMLTSGPSGAPVSPSGYGYLSGTSMAAPHVAGAIAVLAAIDPTASYTQIRNAIFQTVDPVAALHPVTGTKPVATGGRLNLNNAITELVGLRVVSTTPANGSTVATPPTSFIVTLSHPYTPASVQAADLVVNGIAANTVSFVNATTLQFNYATSPVTTQGLQTMEIAAGAITRLSNGASLTAFQGSFRYDAVALNVVSTNPVTPNGIFTLPAPFTYEILFNEAVAPASVGTNDLSLSSGVVTAAVRDSSNPNLVRYTISGITAEGTLNITLLAGALTDVFGNPNPSSFSGSYQVDIGTVPYPVPLAAKPPVGSLTYDPTISGIINFAGDFDNFTIALDAGQKVTLVVTPTVPGLRPGVQLFDPSNTLLGTAVAGANGQQAILQTVSAPTAGTYTIRVGGSAGTTGSYTLQLILNAAVELEGRLPGQTNNTLATAQNIVGSAFNLQATLVEAERAAVLGTTDAAGGYTATSVAFGFNDISTTGTVISSLTGSDDSFASVTLPFGFNFYGTGYTSLFVSSNGLITFGSGNTSFSNTALSSGPTQAAIAPFWDDLHISNSTATARVLTQTIGSPGSRQFIIQWDKVSFFPGNAADTLTFQAILFEGSNQIRFNYLDLVSGTSFGNNGASATVGVKAAGTGTSTPLVQLAFNNGPNTFVNTGVSTVLTPALPQPDLYSFSLDAGQRVSLGLAQQGSSFVSGLQVELLNSSGTVLATGVAASNLNSVISNFLVGTSGTYFARITGPSEVAYQLVVSRNAVFDTEGNNSLSTAQDATNAQGALGHVQSGVSTTYDFETGQQGWTINNTILGTGASAGLWHLTTRRGTEPGHSPVTSFYYARPDTNTYETGARNAGAIVSPSFLVGPGSTVSFKYVLQTEAFSGYDQARVQVSNNGGATWTNLLGPLAEASTWTAASVSLGAYVGQTVQIRFFFDTIDSIANNYEGWFVDDVAIGTAANDDWYKITLGTGETALDIETRTPGDGPGEFVNILNPKIQLFNASGVDITPTVTILPDGRNERFRATGLTAGATYYVRVSGESGTAGEYFVGLKPMRTPTPTVLVDNTNPLGFRVYGSDWSLLNNPGNGDGGFGSNARVHPGNGTATTFAEWRYSQSFVAGTSYEFFVTWPADPSNASNATYSVYDGNTLLGTFVLNQQTVPNDVLVNGTTWERLFVFTPTTSGNKTIRVQLAGQANGRVIADALFDPPLDAGTAPVIPASTGSAGGLRPSSLPLPPAGTQPRLLPSLNEYLTRGTWASGFLFGGPDHSNRLAPIEAPPSTAITASPASQLLLFGSELIGDRQAWGRLDLPVTLAVEVYGQPASNGLDLIDDLGGLPEFTDVE